MAGIKNWSTSAASNNAAPPNGWPEGQAPSTVNNTGRQNMADVRSWYEAANFIDLGHTPTYASSASFRLSGDLTSYYTTNRPIQCTDSTALYGLILSSTYSSPNTTVTVKLDSSSAALSTSLASIAVGLLDPTYAAISAASSKFIQSGTGAVATDVETELRRIVSADQYSTIQDAADYAKSIGAALFIPKNCSNSTISDTLYLGASTIGGYDYLTHLYGEGMKSDGALQAQDTQSFIKANFSGKPVVDWSNSRTRVMLDLTIRGGSGNPSCGLLFARPENGSTEVPNDHTFMRGCQVFGTFTYAAFVGSQSEEGYYLKSIFRNDHLDQRGAVVFTDYNTTPTQLDDDTSPSDPILDSDVDSAENTIATRYWTALSNHFEKCDFYTGGGGSSYTRASDGIGVAGLHVFGTRGLSVTGCFFNTENTSEADHVNLHQYKDSVPTNYYPYWPQFRDNNFHSSAKSCVRVSGQLAYFVYEDNKPGVGRTYSDGEVVVSSTITGMKASSAKVVVGASKTITSAFMMSMIGLTLGSSSSVTGFVQLRSSSDLTDSGATTLPILFYSNTGLMTQVGSWTPSVGGDATYNANNGGRYVKFGKKVTVWGRIDINAIGTGSTTTITGLPFSVATNLTATFPGSVAYFSGLATTTIMLGVYTGSTNDIKFTGLSSAAATPTNSLACLGNSARIDFSITYETTA